MHLLAIADTLSHFSTDVMDKLTQANAGLAKAAFQQNQDPMDSSLYYLSLKKKNVLTHLFKTVRNQQMADFFMQDFNTEHWRKVAAKNAFVLMSKQRFQHAAAFFLLSGSLKDAIQTIFRISTHNRGCSRRCSADTLRCYRLYFRTAAEHMAHGCPMLALDVLSRLPKNISMVKDGSLRTLLGAKDAAGTPDVIAQHLKFVASLRILTEELSTLASGFEVDGGQLRFQVLYLSSFSSL
ncbi:hypothetical protein ANCDUO_11970 [Ancylostoma duodenale]|uniref:RAVE complex protein Rav1 C-terminal domain-containing protein n=1 Tax=Ancylostoma duodenale TaxID=51022 RepID=A0A0C2D6U4_9BILA|nr:hypothetical protein ANCDUO_11970 [Ancylostoma duodenale]